jgi:hypothetical protein
MWIFYVLALIPIAIGGVLWYLDPVRIVWREWLVGTLVSLLLAGQSNCRAFEQVTFDSQVFSGPITQVTHHPRWVSRESTDKKDEYKYVTHEEFWTVFSEALNETLKISKKEHAQVKARLGGTIVAAREHKPGFHSGDQNIYHTPNTTGRVVPMTVTRAFTNRLKAGTSIHASFTPVPRGVEVIEYPYPANHFHSNRLLGSADSFLSIDELDRLNATLGPTSKVNLILVRFDADTDIMQSHWLESRWLGGKPNDLVVCFAGGGANAPAKWCRVFGWTENHMVKVNLQNLLTTSPINDTLFPAIKDEIIARYAVKNWSQFDYITVSPPLSSIVNYILILAAVQSLLWIWFHRNDISLVRRSVTPASVSAASSTSKSNRARRRRTRKGPQVEPPSPQAPPPTVSATLASSLEIPAATSPLQSPAPSSANTASSASPPGSAPPPTGSHLPP